MSRAFFSCLNEDCWCPRGEAELPPALEAAADVREAQMDWPLCDFCLEPMNLDEVREPDLELLTGLAQEAFDHYDVWALRELRLICAKMIRAAPQI